MTMILSTLKKRTKLLLLSTFFLTILLLTSVRTQVYATPAPTLLSPSPGSYENDNTPLFDWTDVVSNDNYNIQISTDSEFPDPEINAVMSGNSPSEYTPSSALAEGIHYWRVRSYDAAGGGWSAFSSVWSLTIDTIAPIAPNVITPEYYGYLNENQPYVEWERDLTALKYRLEFDNNYDYSSPLDSRGTYNWFYTYPSALPDGRYYVRVRSEDFAGNIGPWTEVPFDIDTVAPPAPVLTSPTEGQVITINPWSYDWDSSGGAYFWYLEFSRYSDFSIIAKSLGTNWDAGYHVTLSGQGLWYWRVRQKDWAQNLGPWSTVGSFTLDTIGPAAPVLVAPTDDLFISDTTPYLDWNIGGDAVEYQIMVDTSDSYPSPDVDTTTTNTYYTTTALSEGEYFWKVRGKDPYDNWGSWSTSNSFTVDITNPDAPALDAPGDNEKTNDNTPLLEWFGIGETVYYQVQVDTSDVFSSLVYNVSSLDTIYYQILSELPDDTYYWRVRSQDLAGNWGDWSAIRSFEVDTIGPDAPALVSPTDVTLISGTTPTLLWNSVADGIEYQIQIDIALDFLSTIYDNLTSNTFFAISSSLMDDTYHWRVRARDDTGNWGTWSEVWTFVVDVNGPDSPILNNPGNTVIIGEQSPTLNWSSVADAVQYELELATTAAFGGTIILTTTIVNTYYDIFFTLSDGAYFWRVRAKDSADNWGNWSEIWSFEVDSVGPYIVSPEDIEYEVGSIGQNFSWYPQDANPSNYIIYLDGIVIQSGVWNTSGEEIFINVEGLAIGVYNYTLYFEDVTGKNNSDTVIVTVTKIIIPELESVVPLILPIIVVVGISVWLRKKRK